jgi:hypothetical protein
MAAPVRVAPLILFLLAAPLAGASAKPIPGTNALTGISHCRSISTDAERLACYDRESAMLDQAVAQKDITVINKDDVRTVRRSLFGFSFPNLSALGLGKEDDKSPDVSDLDSKIVSTRASEYGHWEFQIADGDATWRNTDALEDRPTVGAPVHFHKGTLGAYFVKIDGGRAFRAVRVR